MLYQNILDLCKDPDFMDFLALLVRDESIENPAQGIAKMVLAGRASELSDKQAYVFDSCVVKPHSKRLCHQCGGDVLWQEMYYYCHNGGYCPKCQGRFPL